MLKSWLAVCFLVVFATISTSAFASKDTIVFSAAPTENPGDVKTYYQPLLDLIGKVTGKKVVMAPAANYVEFINKMRRGEYDMVFDGPHFVSWRMARLGHVPLARLPGEIRIVVAVRDQDGVRTLSELDVGGRVCAFPSPNMLTMVFLSYFPNPVRQPEIVPVANLGDLTNCLRQKRGDAAVLREEPWNKLDKTGLRALEVPDHSFPERAISISSEFEPQVRAKIAEALVSDEGTKAAEPLLKTFKHERFVAAEPKEYEGMAELLAPLWGFQ